LSKPHFTGKVQAVMRVQPLSRSSKAVGELRPVLAKAVDVITER